LFALGLLLAHSRTLTLRLADCLRPPVSMRVNPS
jgi:hypothetical protein